MSGFKYVIELIEEQMKLMRDEMRFAEGEEIKELQERYKDCNEAHLALIGLAIELNKQPEKALVINGVSLTLLKKYMEHIYNCSSFDYLSDINCPWSDVEFTQEEKGALETLKKEIEESN